MLLGKRLIIFIYLKSTYVHYCLDSSLYRTIYRCIVIHISIRLHTVSLQLYVTHASITITHWKVVCIHTFSEWTCIIAHTITHCVINAYSYEQLTHIHPEIDDYKLYYAQVMTMDTCVHLLVYQYVVNIHALVDCWHWFMPFVFFYFMIGFISSDRPLKFLIVTTRSYFLVLIFQNSCVHIYLMCIVIVQGVQLSRSHQSIISNWEPCLSVKGKDNIHWAMILYHNTSLGP